MTSVRWIRSFATVALVLTALVGLSPGPAEAASTARPVWAHRGGTGHGHVENTRANFRAAAREGSRRWETDVRFTRSGTPVLLHDARLGVFRCPDVSISRVTLTRARKCHAGNGQTINTLAEFAQDVRSYRARAWVELKTRPTARQWQRLNNSLGSLRGRVVIQSFLGGACEAASSRGYVTAFLTDRAVSRGALPRGTDWYAPQFEHVTGAQAAAMHAAGLRVAAWTPARSRWGSVPGSVDQLISNDIP
uniref:GP-PDE domain-containing protein n=1 Tax=uncultured Nocardioidaceae bacterium TaxID=253824 RepID=A0A6J4LTD0_9ACTN|nr:MAG: hypothetical protein AVDCRST_MAG46-1908 [uncultured Nocardioidaceae bacterium]